MKIAAAYAIASAIDETELNYDNILPKPFDLKIQNLVSEAVKQAAIKSGVSKL